MGDQELARKVAESGGVVTIGLKVPGSDVGVDDRGNVRVSSADRRSFVDALRRSGVEVLHEFGLVPAISARVPEELVAKLRRLPYVDYVEPVLATGDTGTVHPRRSTSTGGVTSAAAFPAAATSASSATRQDTSWNVLRIANNIAWQRSTGRGVKVLILDSGAALGHPDLTYAGATDCTESGTAEDRSGQGTGMAGIIAARNNSSYVIGVAHGADLYSGKIGRTFRRGDWAAACLEWGLAHGIHVAVFGTPVWESALLADVIRRAYYQHDVLIVANGGDDINLDFPGSLDEVVAVGGTDRADNHAGVSPINPKIELVAPSGSPTSGILITTYWPPYAAGNWGNGYAAAGVAAVAALAKAQNPQFTATQLREWLQITAYDLGPAGRDAYFGFGIVSGVAASE
jgi:subtilisin family serine protease